MVRPFRFGVSHSSAASGENWKALARQAEDLGYDTFSIADHLRGSFAPMVAAAFVAEATKRVRIGTLVINNDFRHPVLMAREVATLDVLTGGRFEFGIGAGHSGDEYREAGMPFLAGPERVERMEEAIQVMKRMWAGGPASFEGKHYTVTEHVSYPQPVQQPIPMLIGGNDRRVLEVAGREATVIGFTGAFLSESGVGNRFPNFTAETLQDRIDIVKAAAGERFDELELNVLIQGVETQRPRELAEAWGKEIGFEPDVMAASPFVLFGHLPELVDKVLAYRERFGISYLTTHGRSMLAMAPLIQRLKGR